MREVVNGILIMTESVRLLKVKHRLAHSDDVTLSIGSINKLVLIMVLLFSSDCQKGSITINDYPINLKRFRRQSAYIMQDDRLHPLLSVIEAMNFSANLKIGDELSTENKMIRVSFCLP